MVELIRLIEKPWESGWLGKTAYHVAFENTTQDTEERISEALQKKISALSPPYFVSARIKSNSVWQNRCLQDNGFRFIEAYMTLRRRLDELDITGPEPSIRQAQKNDIHRLRDIAMHSFQHDRFHRDPAIPKEKSDLSRAEWVENALFSDEKSLIVPTHNNEVTGFLIHRLKGDDSVLDLMAVHPDQRGRGVGKALTRHFFYLSSEAGAINVVVGTQDVNAPSLNLYLLCGFRHCEVSYSYHLHR